MNVIVSNKNERLLSSLDIEVIKSINGEFTVDEIIETFSNFFFNRMFLDVTAIKNYMDISNLQKLSINLDVDKIILLLDNDLMNNQNYLSQLISIGIFNFANTQESLMYLYNHPNTYKDVAHIHSLQHSNDNNQNNTGTKGNFFGSFINKESENKSVIRTAKVIGFKNVTRGAGATTLIYMLKKTLSKQDYTVALEVNKSDFGFFNEEDMYSINQNNLNAAINKFGNANIILIDLNNTSGEICDDIIYLIEPSIIKLNKMMSINKNALSDLYGKKIVLNKSLLTPKDIKDFEFESNISVTYSIPPLNERNNNDEILNGIIEIIKQK